MESWTPWLALCFKHLMDDFPQLKTLDSLLLGLWKTFHFSYKNRYILMRIQLANGMTALNVIKASVTRWLSHSAACKWCCKRYSVIVDVLDDIISKNPKPKLTGHWLVVRFKNLASDIIFGRCVINNEHTFTCSSGT